jgi:hypothetical protein
MIAIIRKRIFPEDWLKLVFKPYYNGLVLAICFAAPCYLAYLGIQALIKDEIIAFSVLCAVAGLVGFYLFVKKPALLGKDIAYIQPDLLSMVKKRGKKKQKMVQAAIKENSVIKDDSVTE